MTIIEKTPGVCGGRARVRRTRISVSILVQYRNCWRGEDAKILNSFPSLNQSDLNAAWEYYEQNKSEIDAEINGEENS